VGAQNAERFIVFTNDALAKILVEDRHRDIRTHNTQRRRKTATRRWGRSSRNTH
jgi:hypothetical protein